MPGRSAPLERETCLAIAIVLVALGSRRRRCGVAIVLCAGCSANDPSIPAWGPSSGAGSNSGGASASSAEDAGGTVASSSGSASTASGASGSSSGGAAAGGSSSGGGRVAGGDDAGSPAPDAGSSGPADDAGSLEDLCVSTINGYRATIGRPPYTRWTAIEACASGEAETDSQTGVAHSAFGTCNESAQCECPGWPGPLDQMITGCLQAMWDEGPGGGHYEIMASADYTTVACGFYTMSSGSIWAAQDYE
jgi:hypothetical protein